MPAQDRGATAGLGRRKRQVIVADDGSLGETERRMGRKSSAAIRDVEPMAG